MKRRYLDDDLRAEIAEDAQAAIRETGKQATIILTQLIEEAEVFSEYMLGLLRGRLTMIEVWMNPGDLYMDEAKSALAAYEQQLREVTA